MGKVLCDIRESYRKSIIYFQRRYSITDWNKVIRYSPFRNVYVDFTF